MGISDEVVELVDVMPTLMDLAGVPNSILNVGETLDGTSLRPLLGGSTSSSRVGLSLYPRCPNNNSPDADPKNWWKHNSCLFTDRTLYSFIGLSIRTQRWRYTEWRWWDGPLEQPNWKVDPVAVELYDHLDDDGTDFDEFENVNLANNTSYKKIVGAMSALLQTSYGRALRQDTLFVL